MDIPNYVNDNNHYRNSDGPSTQIAWHSLRLTNGMKMPWTTAPATTILTWEIEIAYQYKVYVQR